ncbi:MAG: hypothetical protein P1U34_11495 [Coxiellaceae bacterium]|nr:hypothetical protein [Coxiellaceae bacterium]
MSELASHNLLALEQTDLSAYVIPCFHAVVEYMLSHGVVLPLAGQKNFTFEQTLERLHINTDIRTMSPIAILQQPLPKTDGKILDLHAALMQYCNDENTADLACDYVKNIMAVMTNELAGRVYEPGVPVAENVTEQMHGLQSASLALHYGMPLDYVVAAGLHDIARVTHPSDVYGHKHHAQEGHLLLLPLQLPSYCKDHAFAKWLLNIACPLYRERLISPVSAASLKMQADDPNVKFADALQRLNNMTPADQAFMIHSLMLMRLLLDDFAKVPLASLDVDLQGVVSLSQLQHLISSRLVQCFKAMSIATDSKKAFKNFCVKVKDTQPLFGRVAEGS